MAQHKLPRCNGDLKTCSGCAARLPRTAEFFGRANRNTDGLDGKCRECLIRRDRPKKQLLRAKHRDKINRQKRERRLLIGDAQRVYFRDYGQRPEPRAKKLAFQAKYREQNLERMRASRAAWKKANRHKERIYNARRRDGAVTKSVRIGLIAELMQEQHGCCRWCKSTLGEDYHLDHIVPVSRGGTNERDNFALACPPCNVSKGAKLVEEWRPYLAA